MGLLRAERNAHFRESESPVPGRTFQSPQPRQFQYTQSNHECAAACTERDRASPIARGRGDYEHVHNFETGAIRAEISLVMPTDFNKQSPV
jgi:hypothetical protein